MPQWCIAYGCTNSSDMKMKKSWYRLPLENKELLSKWLAKIRRTNTPVNEHSRLCGDHFETDRFRKIPGSSCVNLKPEAIPTKFCFVEEKTPRKPPSKRKSVERKQPLLYVNNPSDEFCGTPPLGAPEESEEERLRNCPKENSRSCLRLTKRFSVKNSTIGDPFLQSSTRRKHELIAGGSSISAVNNTKFSPFSWNFISIAWIVEVFIEITIDITLNSERDSWFLSVWRTVSNIKKTGKIRYSRVFPAFRPEIASLRSISLLSCRKAILLTQE